MSRVLGIDLGTRRMGVAISDGLGLTAQPLQTIARHGGRRDIDAIAVLVKQHQVDHLVVGLPDAGLQNGLQDGLNVARDPSSGSPSGSGTDRNRTARLARDFAERLRTDLKLPVDLVDESFSTVEAEQILLQADLSRARRRDVIDRLAAAVILQRWLAARAPAPAEHGG